MRRRSDFWIEATDTGLLQLIVYLKFFALWRTLDVRKETAIKLPNAFHIFSSFACRKTVLIVILVAFAPVSNGDSNAAEAVS
jgi:hypothetical protein